MTIQHAVLWMDHQKAIVLRLAHNISHRKIIHNEQRHFHRNRDSLGSRAERDRPYFADVAAALGETPEILLLGSGVGRLDFSAWLIEHRPDLARHVLRNAAWGHATDDELLAEGRRFFSAADRI